MFRKAFYLWLVLAALALLAAKCDDHGDDDNDSAGDADSDGDTDTEAEYCEEVLDDCFDEATECMNSGGNVGDCLDGYCACIYYGGCLEYTSLDCEQAGD